MRRKQQRKGTKNDGGRSKERIKDETNNIRK
jgi:hypothetical protein